MKLPTVIIINVIVAAVMGDIISEFRDKFKIGFLSCARENHISAKKIMDVAITKILPDELYCWGLCWGKKLNLINEDGTFNVKDHPFQSSLLPETVKFALEGVVETCNETMRPITDNSTNCEAGKNLFECLKNLPFLQLGRS